MILVRVEISEMCLGGGGWRDQATSFSVWATKVFAAPLEKNLVAHSCLDLRCLRILNQILSSFDWQKTANAQYKSNMFNK